MSRALQTAIIVIIIAALTVFTFYLVRKNEATGASMIPTTEIYENSIYGFSFSYPVNYQAQEYSSSYIALVDPTRPTNGDIVYVHVDTTDATTTQSYEDFMHDRARLTCAADGPTGSQYCTDVARSDQYTTAAGLTGEVFYLTQETVMTGSATTTREAGPFFAFDISANVTGGEYATLLIRPAWVAEEGELYDLGAVLARAIVDTLSIRQL